MTEIDIMPRRSRVNWCVLIDVETHSDTGAYISPPYHLIMPCTNFLQNGILQTVSRVQEGQPIVFILSPVPILGRTSCGWGIEQYRLRFIPIIGHV